MANAVTTEAAPPVLTENSAASWGSSVSVARRLAALANAASDSRNTARLVMGTAIIPENCCDRGRNGECIAGRTTAAAIRAVHGLRKRLGPNILRPQAGTG